MPCTRRTAGTRRTSRAERWRASSEGAVPAAAGAPRRRQLVPGRRPRTLGTEARVDALGAQLLRQGGAGAGHRRAVRGGGVRGGPAAPRAPRVGAGERERARRAERLGLLEGESANPRDDAGFSPAATKGTARTAAKTKARSARRSTRKPRSKPKTARNAGALAEDSAPTDGKKDKRRPQNVQRGRGDRDRLSRGFAARRGRTTFTVAAARRRRPSPCSCATWVPAWRTRP